MARMDVFCVSVELESFGVAGWVSRMRGYPEWESLVELCAFSALFTDNEQRQVRETG